LPPVMEEVSSVDAVFLAGGQGTRLHPLTETLPKPMVPVANQPWLDRLAASCRAQGVTRILCTACHRWEVIRDHFHGRGLDEWISLILEAEPLGTGGAIRNAALGLKEPFLVFNADVVSSADLAALYRFHLEKGAAVTIALTPVSDPSPYGVVDLAPDGRIRRFVEKPRREEAPSNYINAGIYVFDPRVLDMIPAGRAVSVERETFPGLIEAGFPVYGFPVVGYWNDLGTPAGYLQVHRDILQGRAAIPLPGRRQGGGWVGEDVVIERGARLVPPFVLGDGCRVEKGAQVGPWAVLGPRVRVGERARLQDTVVWADAIVGDGVSLERAVVGYGAVVEDERAAAVGVMVRC